MYKKILASIAGTLLASNVYAEDAHDKINEYIDVPEVIDGKKVNRIGNLGELGDIVFVGTIDNKPIIKLKNNSNTSTISLKAEIVDRDEGEVKKYGPFDINKTLDNLPKSAIDGNYDVYLLQDNGDSYTLLSSHVVESPGAELPEPVTPKVEPIPPSVPSDTPAQPKPKEEPKAGDALFNSNNRIPVEDFLMSKTKLVLSDFSSSIRSTLDFNDSSLYQPNNIKFRTSPDFPASLELSLAFNLGVGFRLGAFGGLTLINGYKSNGMNTDDGLYNFNAGPGLLFNVNSAENLEVNSRLLAAYIQDSSNRDFNGIILSNRGNGLLLEAKLDVPNLIVNSEDFSLGLGVSDYLDFFTRLKQGNFNLGNNYNNTFDSGLISRFGPDILRLFVGYQNDSTYHQFFDSSLNPSTEQVYGNGIKADAMFRFTRNMPLYLRAGTEFTRGDFERNDFVAGLSWYNRLIELSYKVSNVKNPSVDKVRANTLMLEFTYPPTYNNLTPSTSGLESQNLLPNQRVYGH